MLSLSRGLTKLVHFKRDLSQLPEIINYSSLAAKTFKNSITANIYRSFLLKYRYKFSPKEYFYQGLLNPEFTFNHRTDLLSRNRLSVLQSEVNPVDYRDITENKAIFNKFSVAANLPVPELFAVYYKYFKGENSKKQNLEGKNAWVDFLNSNIKKEFVVKPNYGVYGRGLSAFKKEGDKFTDDFHNEFNSEELLGKLNSETMYNSFIFQQRLYTHKYLYAATGSKSLHTLRIITFASSSDKVGILSVEFKIAQKNNTIDNINYGIHGNLLSEVDVETGQLLNLLESKNDGRGEINIEVMPSTGIHCREIFIPEFNEVKNLAVESAKKFFPIRMIGWDIAVSDKGVYLLEGNMFFDLPSSAEDIRHIKSKFNELINN